MRTCAIPSYWYSRLDERLRGYFRPDMENGPSPVRALKGQSEQSSKKGERKKFHVFRTRGRRERKMLDSRGWEKNEVYEGLGESSKHPEGPRGRGRVIGDE